MQIRPSLRLIIAIPFALIAFIFSELIPDLPPFNRIFIRITITVWSGMMGYALFPDISYQVRVAFTSFLNLITNRVSTEVMNQILRLPGNSGFSSFTTSTPGGGISVSQPLILDTSAIIDGRILDIAKTGFLYGTILLPTFILTELQQVADSADYIKRSRGRRGFEIVEELKKTKGIRLEVWDKEPVAKAVDDKLIKLAKNLGGKVLTTDFNLNKVAFLSGVTVLNINDLANSVKTIAVPGETMSIKIIHLGKDAKQGVGYLNDGTMVVVEDGADLVGKEVKGVVTRMLQSSAGRMIFVKTREGK